MNHSIVSLREVESHQEQTPVAPTGSDAKMAALAAKVDDDGSHAASRRMMLSSFMVNTNQAPNPMLDDEDPEGENAGPRGKNELDFDDIQIGLDRGRHGNLEF